MKQCQNCNEKDSLKRIRYGMPGEDFDFDKFHIGGCIPSDATVHFSNCGWENGSGESSSLLE
jgi:hypothetical protein